MNATIDLGDGRQIIVTSDPRSEGIHLRIHACKGSLGTELDGRAAMELAGALIRAHRKAKS